MIVSHCYSAIVMTDSVVLRPYDTLILKASRDDETTPRPTAPPAPTTTAPTAAPTLGKLIELELN
jgi:hypothetical protein